MAKHEARFTPHVLNAMGAHGVVMYKLDDPSFGSSRKFARKRPCDALGILGDGSGRAIAVEIKQQKGYQAFGRRHLADHQLETLEAYERRGGVGLVALVIWEPREYWHLHLLRVFDLPEKGSIGKASMREMGKHARISTKDGWAVPPADWAYVTRSRT